MPTHGIVVLVNFVPSVATLTGCCDGMKATAESCFLGDLTLGEEQIVPSCVIMIPETH